MSHIQVHKTDEELEEDRLVKPDWGAPVFWLTVCAAACMVIVSICTLIMWAIVAWHIIK